MKTITIPLFLITIICSCNQIPRDVRKVLNAAGSNRPELEKVIDHYKASGDLEKLKATYFLIGNMLNKYTIQSEDIEKYDPIIFADFNFIETSNLKGPNDYPPLVEKWDSLVNLYGTPTFNNSHLIPDYSSIRADFLIENIDLSLRLRNESRWGKKISFNKFCEFVLPYRINHEPLEHWRSYFLNKYGSKLDYMNADSFYDLAIRLNKIFPKVVPQRIFHNYPYDIPNSKMVKALKGTCDNIAFFNTSVMRAMGLAVGTDYTPIWGNYSMGHTWNVLFLENDIPLHFYRADQTDSLSLTIGYKPAKIFRETFRNQVSKTDRFSEEIPKNLLNDHRIDVTDEYAKVFNIAVPLSLSPVSKKRYAVICVFNNKDWTPLDFGKVKKGFAYFDKMGPDILYLAMIYDNGELYPASNPFILRKGGNIDFIIPSKNETQDILMIRKYPPSKRYYINNMVNGYFQGANEANFSDSLKLFSVEILPEKIETVKINNLKSFRYIRFISPPPGFGNVAEIELYGGMKNTDTLLLHGKTIGFPEVSPSVGTPYQNVFDGDLTTFFERPDTGLGWVGLDLGAPKRITKIRYCPRTDTNFILEGDSYELCYWDNGKWISMGIQVAKKQFLLYKKVPSDALYILHNLTHGKEERIFTYQNSNQVWW